jgi:hypothetical protein
MISPDGSRRIRRIQIRLPNHDSGSYLLVGPGDNSVSVVLGAFPVRAGNYYADRVGGVCGGDCFVLDFPASAFGRNPLPALKWQVPLLM